MRQLFVIFLVVAGLEVPLAQSEKKSTIKAEADQALYTSLPAARPDIVTDRFALLALQCIHKEYPNKISHYFTADDQLKPPREMTPAFYGCFDWHSAVHGHWLLTRLYKLDKQTPFREAILAGLSQSFTDENIAQEVAYVANDRAAFERPYGIAWFFQLVAELHESNDPQLQQWRETLLPLESLLVKNIKEWLPRLVYPIRLGTHNQTAFAFGLMLDYARTVGDKELETLIVEKSLGFHQDDKRCPLSYEPSGEDFLSPCLMEADLMRRIYSSHEFAEWLDAFLPSIPTDGSGDWLEPGIVLDASDGKLVHLDGVNLSRAWALEGIASSLPEKDKRIAALNRAAEIHKKAGVAAVSDEHYSGSHWLASFATYLETKRGVSR